MKLHYSQTEYRANHREEGLNYHMKLHYSQTVTTTAQIRPAA